MDLKKKGFISSLVEEESKCYQSVGTVRDEIDFFFNSTRVREPSETDPLL